MQWNLTGKKIKNKIREFHFKNMALIHNSTLNESNSTKEIYIVVQQKILWFVSFNSSPIRSILNQHESILRLISKQSLPV